MVFLAFALPFCSAATADEPVDFRRDIRPILSDKCFLCHGPDNTDRQADLRLDTEAGAHESVIVPGSLEDSELWLRINSDDEDLVMPPLDSHKKLSKEEVGLFQRWILAGAKYDQHWAFRPAEPPALPKGDASRFSKQPIDAFVLKRMKEKGLTPSPTATKETLIRRLSLDLTGLPPTIAEVDSFLNDSSPNAYEKLVDRLLQSDHFGQRMAVDWMDIARYGDTSVFHADGPRDMWRWRDWVVDAYNQNMPFDDFTVKQLAGDLLPNSTLEDKIASGFNRNNASTDEGGVIAEEYRVEYVVDRVKTTSMVWLGLSMECAQCHDHKYDPISQKEYYSFYAFFNQAADPGMQTRNGNQVPKVDVPDESKVAKIPGVESQIADNKKQLEVLLSETTEAFNAWVEVARNRERPDPPNDMISHFAMDRVNKKQIADLANQNAKAEIVGRPKLESGRFGKSLRTNNNIYLTSPTTGESFERTDPFSFGCWIYSEGKAVGSPIARMDDADNHRGWDLFFKGDGRVEAHIINAWPSNTINVLGPAKLKPKTWHHFFATYDGSSKAAGLKLFVDGKPIETKAEHDSLTETIKTKVPFTVGRRTPGFPFNGRVDDVRIYDRELSPAEVAVLADSDPATPLLAIDPGQRTAEQIAQLHKLYLQQENKSYQQHEKEIAKLERQLAELRKPLTTVMVMQDVPQMRQTFVLNRGQYDSPDKEQPVSPGVPEFLPQLNDLPKNRLGMAQWIVSPDNPLTARVTVNRTWKMFFGNGIVKTIGDFGSQGQWPSHPDLLDWLATDFVANGWDTKRLIKQIVMSETYRQSSRQNDQHRMKDPQNLYLARGPRFRIAGEFVRDQALSISGLLVDQPGGPGVKPYQPPGLWNEVSLNGNLRFRQDKGDKLYRRSLYTYWKRSSPPPSMVIFDAPTREKCTVRRGATNTPLQALVLMNDPQFVEASRMFAERIMKEGGDSVESKIEFAIRAATARKPNAQTIDILKSTYESELVVFSKNTERAEQLLSVGEKPRDKKLDVGQHAAWTIIGSMILNLDETVTRG